MRSATSLLDEMTAMRLLEHGIFLSNKTPPITNHQALLLLAEGVLDGFVREFKSIVKELLAGCCLDDLRATPEEMRAWFAKETASHQTKQAEEQCSSEKEDIASNTSTTREEASPDEAVNKDKFDDQGRCLKCGSKVSFADATDTLVFVGEDIVEEYAGDIVNRNCVRCTYPEEYAQYKSLDEDFGIGQIAACDDGEGGDSDTLLSYSSDCKEVDEKMKFDMQSKLDEYMRLLEQIKQKTTDERTAVSLLQEVSRDRRAAEIREERGVEQNVPATEKQKNFMKKLGIKFPDTVTKQEASTLIDEELAKNGE